MMQEVDQNNCKIAALIVAGGSGTRAGQNQGRPKQYCLIGGVPVLRRTVEKFAFHPRITHVQVVIRMGDEALFAEAMAGLPETERLIAALLPPVPGGATRQLSVAAGLAALGAIAPWAVLIHDAARPFVSQDAITKSIAALATFDGAIAAAPLTDTLKRAEGGTIVETVPRDGLFRAETPQTFHFAKIAAAHEAARAAGRTEFTDDAAIAEWAGLRVALIETSGNMKITTAHDLELAETLQARADGKGLAPDVRTGTGYDVHAFEEGDHVILCGVKIPHTHKLKGHSDADAPLHALTDALLGTIGAGDIGDHFPPSDPTWRGVDSAVFLRHAAALVKQRGGLITNVDVMIIAERPKIGPHRQAMREHIAKELGLDLERVSVKATTNEKLGFIGRNEGLAAMATATVVF